MLEEDGQVLHQVDTAIQQQIYENHRFSILKWHQLGHTLSLGNLRNIGNGKEVYKS